MLESHDAGLSARGCSCAPVRLVCCTPVVEASLQRLCLLFTRGPRRRVRGLMPVQCAATGACEVLARWRSCSRAAVRVVAGGPAVSYTAGEVPVSANRGSATALVCEQQLAPAPHDAARGVHAHRVAACEPLCAALAHGGVQLCQKLNVATLTINLQVVVSPPWWQYASVDGRLMRDRQRPPAPHEHVHAPLHMYMRHVKYTCTNYGMHHGTSCTYTTNAPHRTTYVLYKA